jgi:hypothetical protein
MAGTRKKTTAAKKPAAPKVAPVLEEQDGQWYIVSGTKRLDVGRNKRRAQQYLDDLG